MNLAKFLKYVDDAVSEMTGEQITAFVHEIARTLPESQRSHFIKTLKSIRAEKNAADNRKDPTLDEVELLHRDIGRVTKFLDAVADGDFKLDSEIDYQYTNRWGWDDDECEFIYSDPEDILPRINKAIELLHRCIDLEAYPEGAELAKNLFSLTVDVDGDYNDYDGYPLEIYDLFDKGLLDGTYEDFVHEALYLIYVGNGLSEKPAILYNYLSGLSYANIKLEDIMQVGDRDLPDFNEFLPLWIEYLGKQNGSKANDLLDEALSMAGEHQYLEAAQKFSDIHPELYKNILQNGMSGQDGAAMMKIGQEALEKIGDMSVLRGEIALLSADYANKINGKETAEHCWLEAFRSNPSVENYLRLRFFSTNFEKISVQVRQIYEDRYAGKENRSFDADRKKAYCAILFFEKRFNEVMKLGLSEPNALGWTYSFMKEGLALFLLLLLNGSKMSGGIRYMYSNVLHWMNFDLNKFLSGTTYAKEENSEKIFWQPFSVWKSDIDISAENYDNWMDKIREQLSNHTNGIMEASRTKYYGECAAFIAAYGEVWESNGIPHAKSQIMEEYRNRYPRRRNFIQALRSYEMPG